VAEYVTGGSVVAPVLQLAVAANCCVAPAFTVTVFGLMAKRVSCAGTDTDVIDTAAVSARPHAQFAITMNVPINWPAVYKPLLEMVPPVAVYVTLTARVARSDHVAEVENCRVAPGARVAPVFGEIVSDATFVASTTIDVEPATPSTVARTSAEPAATAVTTPVELTVTAEPDADHVTGRPVIATPSPSLAVADSVMVPATGIVDDGTAISTTATTGAVRVDMETTLMRNWLDVPLLPRAVTVAAPTARPLIVPLEVTDTTLVLLLLQRSVRPRDSDELPRSVTLSPTPICFVPSLRVTA
jgi:hypothetical protein